MAAPYPARPRCAKPLQYKMLARVRDAYDYLGEKPVCGRPEGHRGHCLSAEVWERDKKAATERWRRMRDRARAAADA